MTTIEVATDFSRFPAGRYETDGPFSGERFREKLLAPAIKAGGSVIVKLDGAEGYGSSFLEEVFGGLIRKKHAGFDELEKILVLSSADEKLIEEIKDYIEAAAAAAKKISVG